MFSQSVLALNHEGDCLELGTPSPPLSVSNSTRIYYVILEVNISIILVAFACVS